MDIRTLQDFRAAVQQQQHWYGKPLRASQYAFAFQIGFLAQHRSMIQHFADQHGFETLFPAKGEVILAYHAGLRRYGCAAEAHDALVKHLRSMDRTAGMMYYQELELLPDKLIPFLSNK